MNILVDGKEWEEYADSHDFGKSYKVIRPKVEKQETHTYKLQLFSYAPILRNPELDERLTLTSAQASAVAASIEALIEYIQGEPQLYKLDGLHETAKQAREELNK